MKSKTLFVILGPTGVGKTDLCIRIAEHFGVPIINADSRQIFSEIPIGTAAPTHNQQQQVQHYFVGTHHITDYYSAAKYEADVLQLLQQEFLSNDMALLSGGSMMYIDAVCKGIDDIPTIREDIRTTLKQRLSQEGIDSLLQELQELDYEHYQIVDKKNPRRVLHALEICLQTGRTYTSFRTNSIKERPFNIIKIGLNLPREQLYERINQRVLDMVEKGLIEEAQKLHPYKALTALNTVGYKELFDYFEGKYDKSEAIRRIQSNTRTYMRKQLTWFKKDNSIHWFESANIKEIIKYIDQLR